MAATRGEPIRIERERLILVEGATDNAFFASLIEQLGYRDEIQLLSTGGKENIKNRVQAVTLSPGFGDVIALGIARDMDTDNALASVQNALTNAKLSAPEQAIELATGTPATAIFLFPDAQTTGELEDLCLRLFDHENEKMADCARNYFRCLDRLDEYVSDGKYAKARLQVLLTAIGEGELPLKQSVKKSWWRKQWQHPVFDEVRQFVELVATA